MCVDFRITFCDKEIICHVRQPLQGGHHCISYVKYHDNIRNIKNIKTKFSKISRLFCAACDFSERSVAFLPSEARPFQLVGIGGAVSPARWGSRGDSTGTILDF